MRQVADGGKRGVVLDLDSPLPGRFTVADAAGADALIARIADRLTEQC